MGWSAYQLLLPLRPAIPPSQLGAAAAASAGAPLLELQPGGDGRTGGGSLLDAVLPAAGCTDPRRLRSVVSALAVAHRQMELLHTRSAREVDEARRTGQAALQRSQELEASLAEARELCSHLRVALADSQPQQRPHAAAGPSLEALRGRLLQESATSLEVARASLAQVEREKAALLAHLRDASAVDSAGLDALRAEVGRLNDEAVKIAAVQHARAREAEAKMTASAVRASASDAARERAETARVEAEAAAARAAADLEEAAAARGQAEAELAATRQQLGYAEEAVQVLFGELDTRDRKLLEASAEVGRLRAGLQLLGGTAGRGSLAAQAASAAATPAEVEPLTDAVLGPAINPVERLLSASPPPAVDGRPHQNPRSSIPSSSAYSNFGSECGDYPLASANSTMGPGDSSAGVDVSCLQAALDMCRRERDEWRALALQLQQQQNAEGVRRPPSADMRPSAGLPPLAPSSGAGTQSRRDGTLLRRPLLQESDRASIISYAASLGCALSDAGGAGASVVEGHTSPGPQDGTIVSALSVISAGSGRARDLGSVFKLLDAQAEEINALRMQVSILSTENQQLQNTPQPGLAALPPPAHTASDAAKDSAEADSSASRWLSSSPFPFQTAEGADAGLSASMATARATSTATLNAAVRTDAGTPSSTLEWQDLAERT
jgi:hypothetical protein